MIRTKAELKKYLKLDNEGWGLVPFYKRFVLRIGGSESYHVYEYFRILRHYEYSINSHSNFVKKIYWKLRFNHARSKFQMWVAPNTVGSGVRLVHPGFLRIDEWIHIGTNCTILPNVFFGKKRAMDTNNDDCQILVGNNVYISTGAIILGPVIIGDNVIIGAGAVVNKDVPNNAVVAGVPAKIIKYI